MPIQKPFLKWLGGKTQILQKILDIIPTHITNYHEPFVGGGSILLAVLSLQEERKITITGKIFASDLNEKLINLYKTIQKDSIKLDKHIQDILKIYESLTGEEINREPKNLDDAITSKESYYYWIRNIYNKTPSNTIESAAMFLFLNKTCFRGMYREGPSGFNVPFGHYKTTPCIITGKELARVSKLIENVEFVSCDFIEAFSIMKERDFVYLDPPYAPENTNSFVNYTTSGFGLDMHNNLFSKIMDIDKKEIEFIMSNANVDLVRNAFEDFDCIEVIARRAINSKNPSSTTIEVIITNIIYQHLSTN